MHCMHQKTDYARYARTQLRKRLHTMHTETRIGVSVRLRGCKCMHLRMHTDCIQAYKRVKERNLPSTSSLYCPFFYLPLSAICRQSNSSLLASSGIPQRTINVLTACCGRRWAFSGFHRPSDGLSVTIPTISRLTVIARSCGRIRNPSIPSASLPGWAIENLYALYASKKRLCMLCENTTPKKTAYNAYRNASRRVRRAEGL